MKTYSFFGKTALITGGSSGIGLEFAGPLAKKGVNLVLIARNEEKLQTARERILRQYAVSVQAMAVDLSDNLAVTELIRKLQTAALSPDILVNSAGFATYGEFSHLLPATEQQQILLNCLAPVALTHALLPAMLQRNEGVVINVASTAACQPVPFMATYGATKAVILSFTEALWAENHRRGIRVLALCPGATETAFFDVINAEEAAVGHRMPVSQVVHQALYSLERQNSYHITGVNNWLLSLLPRFVSRRRMALITAKIMQPLSHRRLGRQNS